jgi:biotin carboxylase
VVGTTPDYVYRLHKDAELPLVFLTDERFRGDSQLRAIPPSRMLFAHLDAFDAAPQKVAALLALREAKPAGVACFDCESLLLASKIASALNLPFPPRQAIVRSRNKFEARRIWTASGISSPYAALTSNVETTLLFFRAHGENIVLKPVSGSGSELLFHCTRENDVTRAVAIMEEQLPMRRSNPLFAPFPDPVQGHEIDPCRSWLAEEFVSGEEFSCDFVYQEDEIVLIRETGKVKAPDKPFGSVLAYTFPPSYPEDFKKDRLLDVLKKAVRSLGFDWGFFMVDYVVRGGLPVLIELTPRPGGDSIPDLVKTAAGRDTLNLYLRFVTRRFQHPARVSMRPQSYASINLYAPNEGTVVKLDGSAVSSLPHVKKLFFKKKEGDRIILPPKDYDNRLLGYCIVATELHTDLIAECRRLEELLVVSITPFSNPSPRGRG